MILLNGKLVEPTIFPDGTSQVWKLDLEEYCKIEWKFDNEAEVFHVLQMLHLMSVSSEVALISLNTEFLPYGRQDHGVSNSTTFALSTLAECICAIAYPKLRWNAFDAHSDKLSFFMGDRFQSKEPSQEIAYVTIISGADVTCFPDEGARKRYSHLTKTGESIHFEKQRDPLTGNLTIQLSEPSLEILQGHLTPKSFLIVDDICDGGATFIAIAAKLREYTSPRSISLYVSHGIFSKGTDILREAGIERIFTRKGEVK